MRLFHALPVIRVVAFFGLLLVILFAFHTANEDRGNAGLDPETLPLSVQDARGHISVSFPKAAESWRDSTSPLPWAKDAKAVFSTTSGYLIVESVDFPHFALNLEEALRIACGERMMRVMQELEKDGFLCIVQPGDSSICVNKTWQQATRLRYIVFHPDGQIKFFEERLTVADTRVAIVTFYPPQEPGKEQQAAAMAQFDRERKVPVTVILDAFLPLTKRLEPMLNDIQLKRL